MTQTPMSAWLKTLPAKQGTPPAFPTEYPEHPAELFRSWMELAAEQGVAEPQAVVLSTVGLDGTPDARVVFLQDVDGDAWCFAGSGTSGKAVQLRQSPRASLTFWWQPQLRSVRLRGAVTAVPFQRDDAGNPIVEGPTLWRLEAERVELWQGTETFDHSRVVYTRGADGWAVSS